MFTRAVIYVAIGASVLSFLGGWALRDAFCDAAKASALEKAMKEAERQSKRADEAAGRLEDYRDATTQDTATAGREIRTIYRDRVIRPDCDIDRASRRLLDRARDNANASVTGEPRVPLSYPASDP